MDRETIRDLISRISLKEIETEFNGDDCDIYLIDVNDGEVSLTDYLSDDEINYGICHGAFEYLSEAAFNQAEKMCVFIGHGYRGPDDCDIKLCRNDDEIYDWLAQNLDYGYGLEMFEGTSIYEELKDALDS